MSEGFDFDAYRRSQAGNNPDKALLVTFQYAAVKQEDGSFENVEMIKIWLGRNDEIIRKVTPEDKIRFAERYRAFKEGEEVPETGTPIKECPLATPADVSACKAQKIQTLEQLVETADERLQAQRLVGFKYKCKDWLEAHRNFSHVGKLREEIETLKQQNMMLKEQNDLLRKGIVPAAVPEQKRRGRPPKVKDDAA